MSLFDSQKPLSPTEEVIQVGQVATDLHDLVISLEEINRIQDIAHTLGDVSVHASSIQHASDMDLFMIESVVRAAVAGTKQPIGELIPNLESFQGNKISLEDLRSFSSNLWKTSIQMLEELWKKFKDLLYRIFGAIPKQRRAIKAIREAAEDYKYDLGEAPKIQLGDEALLLRTSMKPILYASELVEGSDRALQYVEYFLDDFVKHAGSVFEAVSREYATSSKDSVQDMLNRLSSASMRLSSMSIPEGLRVLLDSNTTPDDKLDLITKPMLGNKSIYIHRETIPNESDPIARSEAVLKCTLTFKSNDSSHAVERKEREMERLSQFEITNICSNMLVILDLVEAYHRSGEVKDIINAKEEMLDACKDIAQELSNLPERDGKAEYYRQAMKFSTYLSSLFTQPTVQIAAHALMVNRALITVCEKSLA